MPIDTTTATAALSVGDPVTASQPGGHAFVGTYAGPVEGMADFVGVQHAGGVARIHCTRVSAL